MERAAERATAVRDGGSGGGTGGGGEGGGGEGGGGGGSGGGESCAADASTTMPAASNRVRAGTIMGIFAPFPTNSSQAEL